MTKANPPRNAASTEPPTGLGALLVSRPVAILSVLSLQYFLIYASTFAALGPTLPHMVKDLKMTWMQAGLGFTLLAAGTGGTSFLPAIMIRRFGLRTTLMVGACIMAGGLMCLNQTHGLALYWFGAASCGVGFQMSTLIPGTHILSGLFKRRSLVFGIYYTFGALGGVAGPAIVLTIIHVFAGSWRMVWLIDSIAVFVAGMLCVILIGDLSQMGSANESPVPAGAGAGKPISTEADYTVPVALRTPQFWVIGAAYFTQLVIGGSVASMSMALLSERGVAIGMAGAMLSLESLMQVAARLFGGAVGEFVSRKVLLVTGLGLASLGAILLTQAHDTVSMVLFACCTGIGCGLTALASSVLLLDYYGPRANLELFSIVCTGGVISALSSVTAGTIRDHFGSFVPAFDLFAGIGAVVFIAAILIRAPTLSDKSGGGPKRFAKFSRARFTPEAAEPETWRTS